jgi:hypothetical protein
MKRGRRWKRSFVETEILYEVTSGMLVPLSDWKSVYPIIINMGLFVSNLLMRLRIDHCRMHNKRQRSRRTRHKATLRERKMVTGAPEL